MKADRIAVIGECMVELQKSGALYKPGFGGDTLNTAVYLSRLSSAEQIITSYVTGIGVDSFSQSMFDAWIEEGLNVDLVHRCDAKLPGLYAIETAADGERTFQYWRNDSAARGWLLESDIELLTAQLKEHQLIYLSGISLAILTDECREILFELLQECKNSGVLIAFDNNYRPSLWPGPRQAQEFYQRILKLTSIAFITFDDEVLLYGDTCELQAIERSRELGVDEIVIKRGADDCIVVKGQEQISVPAAVLGADKIIDTTAAGDSFSAGYLAKRLSGGDISESAAAGHRLAAEVIQHPGALIDKHYMPSI
ncbi:sugar kinase [Psychromonas aquimarina]|uniref:sugar kinase n=1 Tax=Psychromonas aquimarina TaxID=444919 RepID=UPI0003F4BFBC|nr:sugar kinase [Psychromonas aquimarina]